jgi:hypothetical protein
MADNKKTAKGSLTIFAALSIMLIAAFLFVLLEAGRMYQIQRVAQVNTESVLESVFANYEVPMWETYQLLVLDNGASEEQGAFAAWEWFAKELSEENISSGSSFQGANHLRMSVEQITFEEYRLITDDDGKAYISAVSQHMKNNLAQTAIDQMMTQYQSLQDMNASESPDSAAIDAADAAIESAKEEAAEDETEASGETVAAVEVEENPLEIAKNLLSTGTLKLVLEDTKSVSTAKASMSKAVSKRSLKQGTSQTSVETNMLDSVLFSQYLLDHFSCYTSGKGTGTLQYELEYMLCGKSKDTDNLSGTVDRLLAVREAANIITLAQDVEKQEIAYSVAVALAGATVNPAIIYAVKCGILAAWALAESILDVRTLLSGGKIAIIKSSTQWTTDLLHLGSAFGSFGKATECSNGLSYERYLGFLLMINEKKCAYRAMDIQEAAIREMDGYEDFYMDNMVTDAQMSEDYSYKTIFLGMESLTSSMKRSFSVSTQADFSYRKAGV